LQDQLTLAALIDSLKRRWWIPLVCLLLAVVASIGITRKLPKIYRASTLILVEPQKIPVAYVRPTVTTSIEDRLRSLQQQITSRTRLERVIKDLSLFPDEVASVPMENLVAAVASHIQLEVRGTTTFRIYYEGTDPKVVAAVANKIAELFISENTEAREKEASSTSEFLEKELQDVKTKLEQEEAVIAAFKREHMGELPEQREGNMRALEALQSRLRTSSESMARARDRRLMLESQISDLPTGGTDVNQVAIQLDQARARLQQLLTQYTDQHPEVILQKREIARLQDALAAAPPADANGPAPTVSLFATRLKTDLESVESEIAALEREQEQIHNDTIRYQQRVDNAPKNEAALNTLTRDYDNMRMNYQSLLNKRVEAKLAENLERERQGEQFNIVDPAVPPASPYKPNLTQIIMLGTVSGLMIGVALAFAIDLLRPRFRSEEELMAAYGVKVLAVIPLISTEEMRRRSRTLRRVLVGSGLAAAVLGALAIVFLVSRQG
jgi:polysaccharide chain length determinant protein (PEP-CTERM system associated)